MAMKPVTAELLRKQVTKLASELKVTRERLNSLAAERIETSQELQTAIEQIDATRDLVRSLSREIRDARKSSKGATGDALKKDVSQVMGSIDVPLLVLDEDLRLRGFSKGAAIKLHLELACLGKRLKDVINIRGLDLSRAGVLRRVPLPNQPVVADGEHLYAIRIQRSSTDEPNEDLILLIGKEGKKN